MRPQIVKILVFIISLVSSGSMFSQSGGVDSNPPPPPQATPPELPIDSGVLLLVIVGILYGAFVLIRRKKTKNSLH
jgi:hypothetical protein